MRFINVLETVEGNPISLETFPIFEEQLSQDVVSEAEELFSKKAQENGADEYHVEDYIETGAFESGTYSVFLVWS